MVTFGGNRKVNAMIISLAIENGPTVTWFGSEALRAFRVFRYELWARGDKRDPTAGDEFDGVRIVTITK